MIAALLLLAQAAPTPGVAVAVPPANWTTLPPVPWKAPPRIDDAVSRFAMEEVKAGRCQAERTGTTATLRLDLALLIDGRAQVRSIVPRAINCPTVEQFGSGLLSRWARDNLALAPGGGDGWYRASITFTWPER